MRAKGIIFAVVAIILLTVLPARAQSAGIKKFPGEIVTLTWTNPTADSSKVTGWRIKASNTPGGPQTFTGVSVTATSREATIPAAFSTNSVMVFYYVVGYVTSGTATVESDPSPTAGVEVDMNVVMPMGVQGK